jgi:iron-sulfur cluster assembly protein
MAKQQAIQVTDLAIEKIKEFAKTDKKAGWGLKILAKNNDGFEPEYEMDFYKEPDENDTVLKFKDVKIYLDTESEINLEGARIDFLDTPHGSGFKINNPAFPEGCTGGCESCGLCA